MKRFQFQQEKLFSIRHQQRRQTEMKLAQADAKLRTIRKEFRDVEESLVELGKISLSRDAGQPFQAWQWCEASQSLQGELRGLQDRIELLKRNRNTILGELKRLNSEVEALESLRQRQWTAYRQSVAKEQQRLLDEVVMGQWCQQREMIAKGQADD